jgi:hypothetical protein
MSDAPEGYEPKNLRFLRRLVTLLTATMIVGFLTVIVLLVIRLGQPGAPPLPDRITLPGGATATAFTQGPDWYAVVTDTNEILIFDPASGDLRQRIEIELDN